MRLTRRQLEIMLERVPPHPRPKLRYEQYTIPSGLAATILWIAEFRHGDIHGRTVADLGCGTGRLAIGALLVGAERAVGVDIDPEALAIARASSEELGVADAADWVLADVRSLGLSADVVIQNPPFGVHPWLRGIDVEFLLKAMEIASEVVYSLHKSNPESRRLLERLIKEHGGRVSEIVKLKFDIPPMFAFHMRRHHVIDVDLYRIELAR